ncbi:LrgB family protein [Bacillus sp. FJAT-47783]|uniref:LrgB family protein n=1 Tax=Bacillus sp. FJAT-47783 TaxID=2922712 RepID=UPI001FADF432|nr:LrgB family protein [Bacillus sp. FJAT-47783]
MINWIPVLMILCTVCVYVVMVKLYKRYPNPLLVPIATSTFVIIGMLTFTHIPYETYMLGGKWIDELLGPAVVALAYPLYENRQKLKEHAGSIIISVLVGTFIGLVSGIALSLVFHVEETLVLSLAPKSVTSPVAMDIASMIGGIPPLAAVYVMIAGISGAMFGPILMKLLRIHHPIAIGIGFGAASHGIGTAKAYEIGSLQGAISSISMTLSAVFTSLLSPFIVHLFV